MAWTAPKTDFAPGNILNAAQMNAIGNNLDAVGGAWIPYTPSVTNLTLGNGTLAFQYMNAGQLYVVRFSFAFGSTSSITGVPEFSTPNGSTIDASSVVHALGVATVWDNGSSVFPGTVLPGASLYTNFRVLIYNAAGTYASLTGITSTVPMTWANTDFLHGTLVYESTT